MTQSRRPEIRPPLARALRSDDAVVYASVCTALWWRNRVRERVHFDEATGGLTQLPVISPAPRFKWRSPKVLAAPIPGIYGWFYKSAQIAAFETQTAKRFLYCLHSSVPTAAVLLHVRLNSVI